MSNVRSPFASRVGLFCHAGAQVALCTFALSASSPTVLYPLIGAMPATAGCRTIHHHGNLRTDCNLALSSLRRTNGTSTDIHEAKRLRPAQCLNLAYAIVVSEGQSVTC